MMAKRFLQIIIGSLLLVFSLPGSGVMRIRCGLSSGPQTPVADVQARKGPIGSVIFLVSLDAHVNLAKGIALDEGAGRLFILDQNPSEFGSRVQAFRVNLVGGRLPRLTYLPDESFEVFSSKGALTSPRGLAFGVEGTQKVLYTLNSKNARGDDSFESELWRIEIAGRSAQIINLNRDVFDLRGAEALSVAYDSSNQVLVTFDASHGLVSPDTPRGDAERVKRGILRFKVFGQSNPGDSWVFKDLNCHLSWALEGSPSLQRKILPDNGRIEIVKNKRTHFLSYGLTWMSWDRGAGESKLGYILATAQEKITEKPESCFTYADRQRIYAAEGPTGRALFAFELPPVNRKAAPKVIRHLAYGFCSLWVMATDDTSRPFRNEIIGIEIRNYAEAENGPRHFRRLEMSLQAEPKGTGCGKNCGDIHHYFARPHGLSVQAHQDIYLPSESVTTEIYNPASGEQVVFSLGDIPAQTISKLSYDPMGDSKQRQYYYDVHWTNPEDRFEYRSVYGVDLWHSTRYSFIYPHLVSDDATYRAPFVGTDLALTPPKDDIALYDFTGHGPDFEAFVTRVIDYIRAKYGVEPDMTNPYWIARNVQEYILDHYSYPSEAVPTTMYPSAGHYPGGPAWFKAAGSASATLWDPRLTESAVVADNVNMCVSAAILFNGVMRFLGIPSRWVGTFQEKGHAYRNDKGEDIVSSDIRRFADLNRNGIFDGKDYKLFSFGHMTTEIYLGRVYGWVKFEGTPDRPGDLDGDGVENEIDDYKYVDPVDGWTHRPAGQIEQVDRIGGESKIGPDENSIYLSMGIDKAPPFFGEEQSYNLRQKASAHWNTATPHGYPLDENRWRRGVLRSALELAVTVDAVDQRGKRRVVFSVADLPKWRHLASGERMEIVQYRMEEGDNPRPVDTVVVERDIVWDTATGTTAVEIDEDLFRRGAFRVMVRLQNDPIVGGASGVIQFSGRNAGPQAGSSFRAYGK
jgi:hypothetical protein